MLKIDSYVVESFVVDCMLNLTTWTDGVKPLSNIAAAKKVVSDPNVVGNGIHFRTVIRWMKHFKLYLEVPFQTR